MALSSTLYRAWLKRLATGRKAKNKLRNPNSGGMCCLGHLAKAAGYEFAGSHLKGNSGSALLSDQVRFVLGLPDGAQGELAHINDSTKGFGEVIKRIKLLRKEKRL